MTAEPTLSQVRDDLVGHLNLDARVRGVEIKQAEQGTALTSLTHEVRTSKMDILAAIADTKPKPIWPAVSALCGVMVVLMALFALIYAGQ